MGSNPVGATNHKSVHQKWALFVIMVRDSKPTLTRVGHEKVRAAGDGGAPIFSIGVGEEESRWGYSKKKRILDFRKLVVSLGYVKIWRTNANRGRGTEGFADQ